MAGFKIEDWFEWVFSTLPWVVMIHGLDQQQFPSRSKRTYQVPDFIVIVETTAMTHQPLLVEVKRVPQQKKTLNSRGTVRPLRKVRGHFQYSTRVHDIVGEVQRLDTEHARCV